MKLDSLQIKFLVTLILGYLVFNNFFEFWIGLCAPGGYYWEFANQNLNFIKWYRHFLIGGSGLICEIFNLRYLTNDIAIKIIGHGGIKIVYSCLGYGIISVLIAFSFAIPDQKIKQRLGFLFISIFLFSILNMIRLFVVSYYAREARKMNIDHHDVFNWLCYALILLGMFFWMKKSLNNTEKITSHD